MLQCLNEAIAALSDNTVLEEVAQYAIDMPEITWEPVALSALALNVKRGRTSQQAAASGAPPLPPDSPTTTLPPPPPDDGAGMSLPADPRRIW